ELIDGLRSATIDLAVIGFGAPPSDLHVHVINDDVLVAAVAAGHPLATRPSLSVRALARYDLICLPRGSGIRASLDEGCAAAQVTARVALEVSNPEVIADLAARGLGVAVLPHSYARTRDDIRLVKIVRPVLRGGVGVAWRADARLSAAASSLLQHWRSQQVNRSAEKSPEQPAPRRPAGRRGVEHGGD
ncbi:MAG: hypothetical protein QOH57_2969, partial [Mycobacterium sp.]|nr:hypothetical protein [Mycobacterium sp.]